MSDTTDAIQLRDIAVSFGGVKALDGVSMDIPKGTVTGLIGPNGSGKSTMVNVVTGMVRTTAGTGTIGGEALLSRAAHRRANLGIARTFQTPRVKSLSTVRDNILVGAYSQGRSRLAGAILTTPRSRAEERAAWELTEELIERFRLREFADKRAGDVPVWALRSVEIARALMMRPQYLLLDEPAAGTDDEAKELLVSTARELAAQGLGVLLIEHHFHLVAEVCSHVIVLNKGQLLARGTPADVTSDPLVIDTYLGIGAAS